MRKTGKEMAQELSNFVNSSFTSENKAFVKTVTSEHRYLQQEMFKMFLDCIEEWAKAKKADRFDPRNEYACKASEIMIEALKKANMF